MPLYETALNTLQFSKYKAAGKAGMIKPLRDVFGFISNYHSCWVINRTNSTDYQQKRFNRSFNIL
jgi:hypothetical protein